MLLGNMARIIAQCPEALDQRRFARSARSDDSYLQGGSLIRYRFNTYLTHNP